jgi:hypothetical protein
MVAFEPTVKLPLFLHFAAAIVLCGAVGHLAVRLWGHVRGREGSLSRVRLHTGILAASYAICFALGCLTYPTFRVRVRHEYFDVAARWATGLFEVKEHFATIGLAAVLGLVLLAGSLRDSSSQDARRLLPLFAGLVVLLLVLIGHNVWSGWFLTTLRGG